MNLNFTTKRGLAWLYPAASARPLPAIPVVPTAGKHWNPITLKTVIMRVTLSFLLLTIGFVYGFASRGVAQQITLSRANAHIETVIEDIRQQSGYDFIINKELIKAARPVSIRAENATLEEVMRQLMASQHFTYTILESEKMVVIKPKTIIDRLKDFFTEEEVNVKPQQDEFRGRVTDSLGNPLPGVTIHIKGTAWATFTDLQGRFTLRNVEQGAALLVSHIGYKPKEVSVQQGLILIVLEEQLSGLNEVQIIGYGETIKRFNTGSVATISAKEIEQQPVTNVLSALSGRMAGVFVQTTNGLPGGNINIQIRGTGSIEAGTVPLYIIDGVPFDGLSFNTTIRGVSNNILSGDNIAGGISPLNSLNPNDIESISVLKDADATAIYGSRGSNGVVLITTKKGQAGTTRTSIDVQQGFNRVASFPDLLNMEEYLEIRREAFANDGKTPSADPTDWNNYAPDLTLWNQTESTDWANYLFGNTGNLTQIQAGVSGGNANTTFNLSANYRTEGTILPGNNRYNRSGLRAQVQHTSEDGKFSINFLGTYNADNNRLVNPSNNTNISLLLAPNYPLYNPDGTYNWYAGANPLAQMQATSKTQTDNVVGNVLLRYTLLAGLNLKTSVGYNKINVGQTQIFPSESLFPGTMNYTNFGDNSNQSFIVEPQLDYLKQFSNATLSVLAGATYQNRISENQIIRASNFSNESLMENLASAGTIDLRTNNYTEYKYASLFGRVNYNLLERYILNGTIRRDGSSRFGPGNRYGTFASLGGAWLFSEEKGVQQLVPFLSFGKLRASYGTTGNDQITDFQYVSTYQSNNIYQDLGTLRPSRISNADFRWETTRKMEAAIELGFIRDRLLLNAGYYRNESDDQLVNYALASMTGFVDYQANLPAVVRNTGWEFELQTQNIQQQHFSWTTTVNLTLPKNVLASFENLETSSYANQLEIGYDITRVFGPQLLGIDPQTGLPQYADANGEIAAGFPYFFNTLGKQTPDLYGGIGNSFRIQNFQLDIFGQFSKQLLNGGIPNTPGVFVYNNYTSVLDRWQQTGDDTTIPKSSTNEDFFYGLSSANLFNVAYFRIKNISLSYRFPEAISRKMKMDTFRLYAEAQNLFTFWDKNAPILDPESGALSAQIQNIPPVRSVVFGLQITF